MKTARSARSFAIPGLAAGIKRNKIGKRSKSMQGSARTWFITGASTGFGRLLAEELLGRGERVAATARQLVKVEDVEEQYPERARGIALDVTKPAEIEPAVRKALAAFEHIDVLVNNAGYG
jgi:NADP-dependent 3-hydroxy acid dehydrogenase YdfG